MRKNTIAAIAGVAALACGASAHEEFFDFALSGDQVNPPANTPAVGAAELIYDEDTQRFSLDLMIFGIHLHDLHGHGPNDTPAHIHVGAPGENGPLAIDIGFFADFQEDGLGIRVQIEDELFGGQQGGVFSDPLENEDALFDGNLYLQVHTHDFLTGELRGQIVPAPASVLALGGLGLLAGRRRR